MKPTFTISIAVHNLLETTKKCLDSIFKYSNSAEYELIVTDNASTDGTADYLSELAGTGKIAKVVFNPKNLGFGTPHNEALKMARGGYFVVLNNDLEVCEKWLSVMVNEWTKVTNLGIVGIKGACCELDSTGMGHPGDRVDYIEASCLMIPTDIAREHGLFDPIYRFAYCEDADLSLRLKRAGYNLSVVDLPIRNQGAATARLVRNTVDLEGYQFRNNHILLRRWERFFARKRLGNVRTRILVRRGGARGDVIMATPIVRAIRRRYPMAEITVSTMFPGVFAGNKNVDRAVEVMPDPKSFDEVFNLDMAYEKDPLKHAVQAYADACSLEIETTDWQFDLFTNETGPANAQQRMPDGSKYAIVHPGMVPGWAGRQWEPRRFNLVSDALHQRGFVVCLVGEESTPAIQHRIDLRNIPFHQVVACMARASLFVGLDSMPLHVAQATRIPIVAIFGCVDPAFRLLPGLNAIGVTAENVGCIGCHGYLPGPRTATQSCVRGDERCMARLSPEQVIAAIDQVLKKEQENR